MSPILFASQTRLNQNGGKKTTSADPNRSNSRNGWTRTRKLTKVEVKRFVEKNILTMDRKGRKRR